MMVGTRDAAGGVSEQDFARQWQDPRVVAEMRRLGLEQPEQLGALFLGDADYVRSLTGRTAALTDDRPKLIEAPFSSSDAQQSLLLSVTDTSAARSRFEKSSFIARLWPTAMRTASLPYFEAQDVINSHMYGNLLQRPNAIHEVHRLLTASALSTAVQWRLGSNSDIQQVLDAATPEELADPFLQFHLGIRLLSERRYAVAAEAFSRAEIVTERASAAQTASAGDNAFALHMYALCMAGECGRVQTLISEPWLQSLRDRGVTPESMANSPLPPFWAWMKETFGIDPRLTSPLDP
jgi:hypothetical protein